MTGRLGFIGDMNLKCGLSKVKFNNLNVDFAQMTNRRISTVQTNENIKSQEDAERRAFILPFYKS
jgi:hypothetical protein